MKILSLKLQQVMQEILNVLCSLALVLSGFSLISLANAQGITAADLGALKGAAGLQGGASGGAIGGGPGLPGLLAITPPSSNLEDEVEVAQDDKKVKKLVPLPPNEFQKYFGVSNLHWQPEHPRECCQYS